MHPFQRGEKVMSNYKVADLKLADKGKLRIEWAESRMPVLMALREKYKDGKPFKGHRIAGCIHVTKETAVLLRTSSVLIAGKNFVVAGFGHCGRGVALRAKGMGANVIVTEVKATAALKATLEGFRVMPMDEAARIGDIFVTATGMKDILVGRHFDVIKDGALVCNTGHYDCEINLVDLEARARGKREMRANNEEYTLKEGRRVYVLGQGRLINLAAAEGHPSEVMDMSFANQFLGLCKLARDGRSMEHKV